MEKRINDFSLRVATVNGTGSQSANNILFKSLFRMGIGVCAKNLFPSNIQGLPTWFQIRVSPHGYQNLREHDDIAVLMNPETGHEDAAGMRENSTLLYNSNSIQLKAEELKPGIILYPIPVEDLSRKIGEPKLRPLLKNLFYVGALSVLYGIEKEILTQVIQDTFSNKQTAIDANLHALSVGMEYATENFVKKDPFEFRRDEKNIGKILIDGNTAAALGSIYGGCTVLAWYPITPSSSLAESTEQYFKKLRVGEDGKAKYAVVQAEDELASIGMVLGASWAGARAMTATAGPGISLMSEFIGLGYYAEIPAVVFDVQRVGPSTGLPTRTQQCDIQLCAIASHGDTKHILLLPATAAECFELAMSAFDLAEQFQTPVFVLSDLDLGMNTWIENEFEYKERSLKRGKVLNAEELNTVQFGRYLDVDGDGIPYRTLPGTQHPKAAYFTRGSGHDEFARYTESPHVYARNMDRLLKKWHTAKSYVPKPVISGNLSSKIGVIAYGTTHHAMIETLDRLMDLGLKYLRLRAYPFSAEVEEFLQSCDQVFVIEQNRDAQMLQLLTVDLPGHQDKMKSILYYGGFPLSADIVETKLRAAVSDPKREINMSEQPCNKIGLSKSDYTGRPSTLCKGCGHDSVTNAIIQAYYELNIRPFDVAKLSGIGCSSKTPAYFIDKGHGFNSVHGRMPSVATGAKLANRQLAAIGISGDGDTASIGLGQFCHLARRNLDMTYVIENNGTYGLTKGQFSSTADQGSKSKKGMPNPFPTIDCCALAIELGATFVARSFSGDRKQMISLIKAAHSHKGIAILDILSPCVTFNNHTGSTKSYLFVKDHDVPLQELGYVPSAETIEVDVKEGELTQISLHDGSTLTLKKLGLDYDATNKKEAMAALEEAKKNQTVLTGLLYYAGEGNDLAETLNLTDTPLSHLTEKELVPSADALKMILSKMR